jgi:hypothetical protein
VHQLSAVCPSCQPLTLAACSRQTEIIDSMQVVDLKVRASVGAVHGVRSLVLMWQDVW